MKNLMRKVLALALACTIAAPAYAGVPISDVHNNGKVIFVQAPDGTYVPAQSDASGNTAISGSISATLAGFTPNGNVASLSVTTASANVALPAGTVVLVTNTGTTNTAFIKITVGASTAATTDMALVAGATVGLTVGSNTFINAITASSTTTLRLAGGTGLVSGYGGGGGSGGGGGAVTIADAADATLGAKADAKSTATDTTAITAMQVLKQISASVQAPPSQAVTNAGTFATQSTMQAGSAIVGKISQVDSGGTDATDTTLHAVKVNVVSATGVAQGSTTSGQTVSPIGCRTLTSAPTDTTAQTSMPWCRTNGTLAQDLASINGTTVSTGTGAQGSGTPRFTVATDTATIAGSAPGTAGSASANVVTVQGVASMTPVLSQSVPGTANGLTLATVTAANSTNATNLKASAGQLYHVTAYNNSATLAWVSFYNTSGTPSCGTSIVYQMMIPANSTSGAGAIDDIPSGLVFSSGIGYCITTGIAGTGSVAASAYVVNFAYK